ncbi:hypothetical protein [Niveispirillum lacus]|uniref:hypothetical protein n=1 Tax=Niveispirillum lacus TaxID=1981099 RepID=UPI0013FDA2C4|nr:hypothetical protein [Niveispirillum lacus]
MRVLFLLLFLAALAPLLPAAAQTTDLRCGPDLYRPGILLTASPVCGLVYSQHLPGLGRLHLGAFHSLDRSKPDAAAGRVVNLTAGTFTRVTDDLATFTDYGLRVEDGHAAAALYHDFIHYMSDDLRFFAGYEGVRFFTRFARAYDSLHVAAEQKIRLDDGRLTLDLVAMAYWTRKGDGPAADSFSGLNPWVEATWQPWRDNGPRWHRVLRFYTQIAGFTGQPGRPGLYLTGFAGVRTSF